MSAPKQQPSGFFGQYFNPQPQNQHISPLPKLQPFERLASQQESALFGHYFGTGESQRPQYSQNKIEGLVSLCKGTIAYRQCEELIALDTHDEQILKKKFYTGELRIGISQNNLYWNECAKIFSETKNTIETIKQQVEELEIAIGKKTDAIEALKNKKKQLTTQLKELKTQMNQNLEKLSYLEIIDSLQEQCNMVANIEKNLVAEMEAQLVKDINKFSALTEVSKYPKLSLIFNAMGLSKDTINSLRDFSGVRFNNEDLNDWFKFYGINDFVEQKELFYIRHMMQYKLITTDHVENCVVCLCTTPLELKNLLIERDCHLSFDLSPIEKYDINGPRFLFINYSDCKNLLKLKDSQIRELMQVKDQLSYLHLYDKVKT